MERQIDPMLRLAQSILEGQENRRKIVEAVRRHKGSLAQAAEELGISRERVRQLYRKAETLGEV